jgi:hypothetical protein
MGISSQNTLLKNFSPVLPSLTSNSPIDSVRLAKTQGNIENFPKFILGQQPGKFIKMPPSIPFQPVDRFPKVVRWSIHLNRRNKMKTSKFSQYHCRGASEEFSWKNTPKNKFITVRPIFTINIPIGSGLQAEKCGKINNFKFHARGAIRDFLLKEYPQK